MKMKNNKATMFALLAAGLLAAGSATARNDKLLLPISAALAGGQSADVPVQFGSATAVGADAVLGTLDAHGVGNPTANAGSNAGYKMERRSDTDVCQDAFRKAALQLQQRARQMGGVAVVGVVGNYHGATFDSATHYECHIGVTRGVVDLKGQAARMVPASLAR